MKFHKGGQEELMRGAGIDSTLLFDQVSCMGTVWVAASTSVKIKQELWVLCFIVIGSC